MPAGRLSLPGRLVVASVVLPVLAGCHTYVPLATPQPAPGTQLSLVLNDEGRAQTMRQVGPYTARIEGQLVQATESDYVVGVTGVVDLRGARSKWTGETVPLPRSYVMQTFERRYSRSRTALLVTVIASGLVAFVTSWNLLGFGGSSGSDGGGGDQNGQ
jgi:hypothetical protein